MAKYSDIKGFTVQTLSTDTVASQTAGGAWASGGSLPTAKWIGNSAGTQTSNLFAGGATDAPATPNITATSFEYNGTSWTAGGDMNESRIAGTGFGASNTAAVVAVGNEPTLSAKTETYNGTAFTEVADANQARGERVGGGGTSTAGVIFGGANPPGTMRNETETWDGSSWTETGNLNTARMQLGSSGIAYTASIAFGGYDTAGTAKTETFDGSSWTEVADLNTAREGLGGSGTSTATLAFSGLTPAPARTGATENFDGSTWTELADLSTTRYLVGGSPSGTNVDAIAAGGLVTEAVTNTEEWSAPSDFNQIQEGQLFYNSTANAFKETIFDLPAGSWSSGGDLNTARKGSSGFGVLTSNIVAGGLTTTIVNSVESYDGSSWTEITELNTARRSGKAVGSTTAGLVIAGVGAPPSRQAQETENWNGSAWTEVGDINRSTATQSFGSAGASNTSAMIFGGEPGTGEFQYTETWDGSSWTEVNNLNTGRQSPAGFGIVTAAICAGGYSPPAPPGNVVASNESWDGTNWTEVNDLNTARGQQGGSGAFTSGLIYGGNAPPGRKTNTESWNGTSYTELNDMATSRYEFGYAPNGVSPQNNTGAIVAGGYTTTNVATTEEWAVDLANKTITST